MLSAKREFMYLRIPTKSQKFMRICARTCMNISFWHEEFAIVRKIDVHIWIRNHNKCPCESNSYGFSTEGFHLSVQFSVEFCNSLKFYLNRKYSKKLYSLHRMKTPKLSHAFHIEICENG